MRNKRHALYQQNGRDAGRLTIPSSRTEPGGERSLSAKPKSLASRWSRDECFLRTYWGSGAVPGAGTPGVTGPSAVPAFGERHIAHVLLACGSGDLSWPDLRPWEAEAASQTSLGQKARGQRCVKQQRQPRAGLTGALCPPSPMVTPDPKCVRRSPGWRPEALSLDEPCDFQPVIETVPVSLRAQVKWK